MLSVISENNLFPSSFSFLNASKSLGGYSDVVRIVYKILKKKTNPPTAKATLTDIGTIPDSAELLKPSQVTIVGRLLAIQVPIPIISV